MKHLPKHLRPRYRYLAVEIETWPSAEIDRRSFQAALWDATRALVGDPGSADVDPRVFHLELGDGDGEAVIRVRRGTVDRARAAIACINTVSQDPVRVRVLGTSGTVRACQEKFLEGLEETVDRRVRFRGAGYRGVRRGDRVDVETDDCFTGGTALDIE